MIRQKLSTQEFIHFFSHFFQKHLLHVCYIFNRCFTYLELFLIHYPARHTSRGQSIVSVPFKKEKLTSLFSLYSKNWGLFFFFFFFRVSWSHFSQLVAGFPLLMSMSYPKEEDIRNTACQLGCFMFLFKKFSWSLI